MSVAPLQPPNSTVSGGREGWQGNCPKNQTTKAKKMLADMLDSPDCAPPRDAPWCSGHIAGHGLPKSPWWAWYSLEEGGTEKASQRLMIYFPIVVTYFWSASRYSYKFLYLLRELTMTLQEQAMDVVCMQTSSLSVVCMYMNPLSLQKIYLQRRQSWDRIYTAEKFWFMSTKKLWFYGCIEATLKYLIRRTPIISPYNEFLSHAITEL